MIDSDGHYISRGDGSPDEQTRKLTEENQAEIQQLLLKAREMWEFD